MAIDEKKMNAKKMFYLMGFVYRVSPDGDIIYSHRRCETEFWFYLEEKTFECIDIDNRAISIQEHLAVHKQMKELGWIE